MWSRRRVRVREFEDHGLEDDSESGYSKFVVSLASPSPGISSRKKCENGTRFSEYQNHKDLKYKSIQFSLNSLLENCLGANDWNDFKVVPETIRD